jgi:hypothetical protein
LVLTNSFDELTRIIINEINEWTRVVAQTIKIHSAINLVVPNFKTSPKESGNNKKINDAIPVTPVTVFKTFIIHPL